MGSAKASISCLDLCRRRGRSSTGDDASREEGPPLFAEADREGRERARFRPAGPPAAAKRSLVDLEYSIAGFGGAWRIAELPGLRRWTGRVAMVEDVAGTMMGAAGIPKRAL
jgi:hypothetical protein